MFCPFISRHASKSLNWFMSTVKAGMASLESESKIDDTIKSDFSRFLSATALKSVKPFSPLTLVV